MKRPALIFTLSLMLQAGVAMAQQPVRLDTLRVTVGSRVSAQLPLAVRAVQVIDRDELARQSGQNIQDVLARALGVDLSARSPAQADLAIRGGGVEQVLVLVDGVRVSDAQTGHFDLSLTVPLHDVERIEVLRGPATALYGANALGGVVNIVTRRPDATRLSGTLSGGSFETMALTLGGMMAGSRVRVSGTGDYRRSQGHRTGTDYDIATGHATIETLLAGRPLRATFGLNDRDFGAAKFYTSPAANFDEFERTRTITASAAWEANDDVRFAIEPRVSVRRHHDDFVLRRDDPAFYQNVHSTWQLGSEVTARYSGTSLRAALGGAAYRNVVESTNLGDHAETRAALFAEAGAGTPGIAVGTAGVRYDWHSTFDSFLAPSLAGAFWLYPALHVRASLSRAFRAPTWTDRYYSDPANQGDPDLEPEHAWEGEAGVVVNGATASGSAAVFTRRTTSLIDWTAPQGSPPTTLWQIMNLGAATFRGVELELRAHQLLGARWTARFSGIAFDHAAEDVRSKYALRPLTRQASLDVQRNVAGLDLFLRTAYARRAQEDSYLLLDTRVSRTIRSLRIFLDLSNAADAEYRDISQMPAPGRTLHLGLDWNLNR